MKQKNDILKSVIVLTVICLVTSAALAVVNHFTAPVSAANALAREEEARREVASDAGSFEPVEGVELPPEIQSAFASVGTDGKITGYVFTVTGDGFGGPITVMCAIDMDERIIDCSTLDVSGETKTLGGRVMEEEYTNQFAGQDATLGGVETISGATVTSHAYEDCVRRAFEAYAMIKGAGA